MATEARGEPVAAHEVLGDLTVVPLPEGTSAEAVFMLIKLDDGDWCARSVGEQYNRVEFLGQLSAYTHSLKVDEASGWFDDGDLST